MAGVLLEPVQIDARSGVLTLFGPKSTDSRSACFVVNDKPFILTAFNLQAGQKITLYNVAQVGNTVRESIFKYNGNSIELTAAQPTAVIALTGTYRLVMNGLVGSCVAKAYPQQIDTFPVSPLKSDVINSLGLFSGQPSSVIQVTERALTVVAYGLGIGQQISVYFTADGADALYATLTKDNTLIELSYTGDYRLLANVDAFVTVRPNYVEFENPYVTQGVAGQQGPPGESAGIKFTQSTPSDTWIINHNLGYTPAVDLFTVGGVEFDATVINVSENQTAVYIDTPIAGYARLT